MTRIAAVSSSRVNPAMIIFKLKTPGVIGGLLVGLVLGTALAALFSATPPARAQVQAPPATPPSALPRLDQSRRNLARWTNRIAYYVAMAHQLGFFA
jgi:hypothetical protein